MTFEQRHSHYQAECAEALKDAVRRSFVPGSQVGRAAEYAVMNGGKRVRGVLVQAVSDMLGGDDAAARVGAAAIEMIHAFSLVHDDLPCMDDDDMRRGKPATHIAFGEATALLAGDLLAVAPFGLLAGLGGPMAAAAAGVLAKATGDMIYGQELDLKYEEEPADEAALRLIHENKTGALILGAARLGVAAAGVQAAPAVETYALNLGLVFQIVDDILDVTSTDEALGKPVGSDAQQGKTTFVTMFGMEKARAEVQRLTGEAVAALQGAYDDAADFLCEYARLLAARVN